jgi:hypothetical protein
MAGRCLIMAVKLCIAWQDRFNRLPIETVCRPFMLYISARTACNLHQLWYLGLSYRFEKFQAISTHLLSTPNKLQQLESGQQQADTMNYKIMLSSIKISG